MYSAFSSVVDISGLPHPGATSSTISTILNIVFGIATSVALLVIVIAGFRYIAAHGDPNTSAQARNTIIYAVVGLMVTITAYAIVAFVVKGIG